MTQPNMASSDPSLLTKEQKKRICSLLGNVELHLLYKGSVHGYSGLNFHDNCDNQGPTLIVAYSTSGEIFGGYTSKNYTNKTQYINDEKAFLFQFQNTFPIQFKITTPYVAIARCDHINQGPCFGNEVYFLYSQSAVMFCQAGKVYNFTNNIHSDHQTRAIGVNSKIQGTKLMYDLSECEVFRVTKARIIEPVSLREPWRNVLWTVKRKEELMESIKSYKPLNNDVNRIRVLLIGPVGAGKSSFFNSINSVFRGHITSQAMSGSSGTSVTTQYRMYAVRDGRGGNALPLILCDTMGMQELSGAGLNVNDIRSIIKGYIPDRYKFNPAAPFEPHDDVALKNITLQDKVHCVAYVLDAAKVNLISSKMEEKLEAIRNTVNSMGIPQIVLLTKVDEACPIVERDLQKIYLSDCIKTKFQVTSNCVGVPLSNIMPVKNYRHEMDLDLSCDILLLTAVQQMLRFADNYFDDISPV